MYSRNRYELCLQKNTTQWSNKTIRVCGDAPTPLYPNSHITYQQSSSSFHLEKYLFYRKWLWTNIYFTEHKLKVKIGLGLNIYFTELYSTCCIINTSSNSMPSASCGFPILPEKKYDIIIIFICIWLCLCICICICIWNDLTQEPGRGEDGHVVLDVLNNPQVPEE